MFEQNSFDRDSQRNCWNCRLYDCCERKYYITDVCEQYRKV